MSEFKFCFTLDTEPDNLWRFDPNNQFDHLPALEKFHDRMSAVGSKQTYLTTSEIAEFSEGQRTLSSILDRGAAEIGVHFHTWTRDWPFETPELRDPAVFAMAHNLGQKVEQQMMEYTVEALYKGFGVNPKSHRGGRWSFNDQTALSLANTDLVVDSTVTPGLSWRDNSHPLVDGPDYRNASRYPSLLAGAPAGKQVVEIPVGSAEFLPNVARNLEEDSFSYRALRKLYSTTGQPFGTKWLRPTSMSVKDMTSVLQDLKQHEVPVWVFMIHSSEVIPCNPLPETQDVENFVRRCEDIVEIAQSMGAQSATLEEAGQWLVDTRRLAQ